MVNPLLVLGESEWHHPVACLRCKKFIVSVLIILVFIIDILSIRPINLINQCLFYHLDSGYSEYGTDCRKY